jgi:hypothetical protein
MSDHPMHPSHPEFWNIENYWARRKKELIADVPRVEREREQRRLSAINQVVCHIRVIAEQRREAIIAALQGEHPVPVQLLGEAGREPDLGLLEGKHELGKEHLGSATPNLQILDLLIDILRHAVSPIVDASIDTAENSDAHRSNGGDQ